MRAKKLKKWIAFVLAAVMLISSLSCMSGLTSQAAESIELTTEAAAEETTQTTSETTEVTTESTESEETGTEETTESVTETTEAQVTEEQTTESQTERTTMKKLESGALVFSAMTDSEKRELLLDLLEDKNEPGSREWLCNLADEQIISIFGSADWNQFRKELAELLLQDDTEDRYVYWNHESVLAALADAEIQTLFGMERTEFDALFENATDSDAKNEDEETGGYLFGGSFTANVNALLDELEEETQTVASGVNGSYYTFTYSAGTGSHTSRVRVYQWGNPCLAVFQSAGSGGDGFFANHVLHCTDPSLVSPFSTTINYSTTNWTCTGAGSLGSNQNLRRVYFDYYRGDSPNSSEHLDDGYTPLHNLSVNLHAAKTGGSYSTSYISSGVNPAYASAFKVQVQTSSGGWVDNSLTNIWDGSTFSNGVQKSKIFLAKTGYYYNNSNYFGMHISVPSGISIWTGKGANASFTKQSSTEVDVSEDTMFYFTCDNSYAGTGNVTFSSFYYKDGTRKAPTYYIEDVHLFTWQGGTVQTLSCVGGVAPSNIVMGTSGNRKLRITKIADTSMQTAAYYSTMPSEYKDFTGAEYGIYTSISDAQNDNNALGYCWINNADDNISENMHTGHGGTGSEAYVPSSVTRIYIKEVSVPTNGKFEKNENIYWANIASNITGRVTIGEPRNANGVNYFTQNGKSGTLEDIQPGKYLSFSDTANFGVSVSNTSQSVSGFADKPILGSLAIKKVYSNPDAVKGNSNYSLEGAQFGVYGSAADANADKNRLYTLTTDADGNASLSDISTGTYYIKEVKASKGCCLNTKVYTANVTVNHTASSPYTVTVPEDAIMDPLSVLVTKQGDDGKPVAGALYTIKYYSVSMDTDPAASGYTAAKTWVYKTGTDGRIYFGDNSRWFVSGDSFYKTSTGAIALPAGTVTVQEKQAPEGYLLNDTVYPLQIKPNDNSDTTVSTTNPVSIIEEQERGDISFYKKDEDGNPLANVKFQITDANGESHIVWTDENGYYSTKSSYIAHSKDTNSGEAGSGIWFGTAEVKDTKGALPYGTYTIKELRCEANKEKYKDIEAITFSITTNGEDKVLDDITNYDLPTISTTVRDAVTDTNVAALGDTLTFIDTVHGVNLEKDHKYTLTCKIWSKSDNDFLKDADGNEITTAQEFTATDETMDVDVTATIDVTENLIGQDIVCYEYLTDEAYPGETVASHEDVTDEGQTIHFPEIGTTAKDAKTYINEGMAEADAKIIDTVAYTNLVPGKTYTMIATVMNQGTNKALTDADGNEITVTKEFVPDSSSGSVDVEITFDASLLAGENVTVFEDCTYNGHTVAIHADITDEGQTVHFPEIGTTAEDAVTGTREALADAVTTLIDTVAYTNLIVDEEHTVKGTLHYTDTGEAVTDADGNVITAETTFTPEKADGSVTVTFTFDASLLAGETITVFEDVYYKDREVASHADLTDEGQTVHFPKIGTTAKFADGSTQKKAEGSVTVIDTVFYSNLKIGETYTVNGCAAYADSGEIVSGIEKRTSAFTAESETGSIDMSYTFDAKDLTGKDIVFYEYLYDENGNLVASHADRTDKGQTVSFTPDVPKTGDTAFPVSAIIFGAAAACGLAVLAVRALRKRKLK